MKICYQTPAMRLVSEIRFNNALLSASSDPTGNWEDARGELNVYEGDLGYD